MEITILGRVNNDSLQIDYLDNEYVFVDYVNEDVCVGDIFKFGPHTIELLDIKLQFKVNQPLTRIDKGWKFIGKFAWLDLTQLPSLLGWDDKNSVKIQCERLGHNHKL